MKRLLAILLLLSVSFATIQLVTPKHIALRSLDEVEVSPVGPGHEVFLKFQRKVSEYMWDEVRLVNTVDPDWELDSYSDYKYIYYSMGVPPSKASGKYTFQFEISDREGLKDSEVAIVQVVVTHGQDDLITVFEMPKKVEGFADREAPVSFDVENKALSRVNYKITYWVKEQQGLAKETITQSFLSGQTKAVTLPVVVPEEGEYTIMAKVWSEHNPNINKQVSTRMVLKPTFRSKLRSIGKGFPLVPLTMAPFYAVFGIFGW
ncbi:MAG: hypothetical protein KAW41_05895 [Candidatus Diapherotrites archaeon]|nr:hypothetical protein [Candidatus Diapherotrites archaeon]